MSDKSKLGFNINPKNYDELNSADNLITSGSDSGWLGKKLQGDDSNDLDLSKINPLFDKELYEKYRPGVNTNDGSVNQDIWGYKCFNSPVSFRNGIYGDTYSIHSIDTYEGDTLNNTKKNGIIIQPYNKQAGSLNNIDSAFRICNEKRSEQKDDKDLIYIDTRETHIQHSYTGKENQHNVEDVNLYDILKNTYIDGANTENISYTQSNVFPGSGEYSISFIQNTFDHCTIYSSNSTHRENAVTYNGINTFSNKKIDKQIGPFPYITTYNYKDFVNITSSIYYTNNIGTDEEPKYNYNISRITIGTECGNDPVIEKEITANSNCIRMYSADGTHGNSGYTNDNISSIIITPEIINTSVDNKIITIDYHTDKLTGDDYNYSKPVIDIAFDYTKVTDDPANLILFQMASLLNIQDATVSDAEDAVPSINVHGIFKNGNDDVIKYRGTRITPTSIAVNAIQFNRFIMGDTFISNTHNKLVPVEYIFKQNDTDETGTNTYGLKLLSCDGKLKTSFICDYLVVNESIKYKSTVSYTDRLVYIDPETSNTTNVLTVQSSNLILPRGNKTIQLGRDDNRFGTIYGDLNGTAVLADHAATAEQATKDQDGNIIKSSYLNILDFGRNDIESYNAIIGNEKEKLLFLKEKYFSTSADIPPKNKSYASIKCSFTDTLTSYKTIISWSNEAEDKPITKLCHVDYNLAYNYTTKKHSFYLMPNGVASDDPKYVESMNIGAPDAPWDNIYCKNFPTIHNTLIGHGVSDSGSLQTSIGCIRLLCVKVPKAPSEENKKIRPGMAIRDGKITIDSKEYLVYLAGFAVEDQSNNIQVKPISDSVVADSWCSLSGIFLVNNSENYGFKYIPILAIRSY